MEFLSRRVRGDWGELCEEDRKENQLSVEKGFRILGSYRTDGNEIIWENRRGKVLDIFIFSLLLCPRIIQP